MSIGRQNCSTCSNSRCTRGWPMVVFYRIVDLSVMNAYIFLKTGFNSSYHILQGVKQSPILAVLSPLVQKRPLMC